MLDCRVNQPQASYLYQSIIVFCQYSVSCGIAHSPYYTIQYIYIIISVRYVPYLSSVPYVLSSTVLTHIIMTTPGCTTVLTPYTVGLIRCNRQFKLAQEHHPAGRETTHTHSGRCDGYTPVKTDISRLPSRQSTSKRLTLKHARPLSPIDTTYTMTGRHPKL